MIGTGPDRLSPSPRCQQENRIVESVEKVLFAYSRGITSSRDIAQACAENVTFMALSADTRPHFTTIADFISTLEPQIAHLYGAVLTVCAKEGLIGRNMFAVDGCKIAANCSKENSGTRKHFENKSRKLEKLVRKLVQKHRKMDIREVESKQVVKKEKEAIRRLRGEIAKLKEWLKDNDDKIGPSGRIKQSNLTDNDSAKMPTSHGVIQGYNGQAMVDSKHQVVVHAEVFGEGFERHTVPGVEDQMPGMQTPGEMHAWAEGGDAVGGHIPQCNKSSSREIHEEDDREIRHGKGSVLL